MTRIGGMGSGVVNRRDFVRGLGFAGGLTALPWRGSFAAERTAPAQAEPGTGAAASVGDNDPGVAGEAWREFVEVLRGCDRSFVDGGRGRFDDGEMAYAYRNLAHILSFAIDLYMYGEPASPVFIPVQNAPWEKTLGGSPDVHYSFASVRGDRRYRITGRRGDEAYLSFTLHRGVRGSGFEQFFESHLNHHDLKTDADGRFEVIVSREREGENWLRSSADATEVYARAYMLDRIRGTPARFHIEPLDAPTPERPSRETVAKRLREMTRIVREMTEAIPQPLRDPNQIGELWQIDPKGPSRMWQALDNVYNRGAFDLRASEALVLEGVVVPCDYWGIQLWNPFLGSGDYRWDPVSINTAQAHLGEDGRFRVAIAREDPRVPGLDWISTAGERQGTFFIRWLCPKTRPPTPTCRLATLAELRT